MEVLAVFQIENDVFAQVKIISGKVHVNMILEVKETRNTWQIDGLAYISPETDRKNIQVLTLKKVKGDLPLRPGQSLYQI